MTMLEWELYQVHLNPSDRIGEGPDWNLIETHNNFCVAWDTFQCLDSLYLHRTEQGGHCAELFDLHTEAGKIFTG